MQCRKAEPVQRTGRSLALCGCILLVTIACNQEGSTPDVSSAPPEASAPLPTAFFTELSVSSGLDFQHYSGASGDWHVPEILGSGVALFDYDGDGDLDVYFVQSSDYFRKGSTSVERFPLPDKQPRGHRLYANQLVPHGTLEFTDVTEEAGLVDESYGMGVAAADYDNDGDIDLYVTSFGANALYTNTGGVFRKHEGATGAQDERWSTSATFCDVNNDQLLDLYVSNYVYYKRTDQVVCRDSIGQQDYCGPQAFTGAPDALYINNAQGGFIESSNAWGINTAASTGLGVVCRDFNLDGAPDVYVANDAMPNLLWLNREHTKFEDQGQLSGSAINVNGMVEGSMGIAAGDYDSDGDDDIFITHWDNETNTLYRNDGKLGFIDFTRQANLSSASLSHTGFGTEWIDLDNDSDLDLFVANGAVQRYVDSSGRLSTNYGQKNQIFINNGKGRFKQALSLGGDATLLSLTGRGAAFGDIDNDGDVDVVVSNKDERARLFVNQQGQLNAWLGIKLTGTRSSRDAEGAVVTLTLPSGQTLRRVAHSDGSYLSASDSRILFGLSQTRGVQAVDVQWPSGTTETFASLETGRYHLLVEGNSARR